jgi:hypothetical protein
MDAFPKQLAKFTLMGAALVFIGHKLFVAIQEGRIRGRHRTYSAVEDPMSFDISVVMYAAFAVIIVGMILHELWKASR